MAWKSDVLPTIVQTGAAGLEQGLHARIVGRRDALAPRHAKGTDLGMLQIQLLDPPKVLHVLLVRERIATFDVVDTDLVESLGDLQLVQQATD